MMALTPDFVFGLVGTFVIIFVMCLVAAGAETILIKRNLMTKLRELLILVVFYAVTIGGVILFVWILERSL